MSKFVRSMNYEEDREEIFAPRCHSCKGELFSGEVYYEIGGQALCRDCLDQLARRIFCVCRRQVPEREGWR